MNPHYSFLTRPAFNFEEKIERLALLVGLVLYFSFIMRSDFS